MAPPPSPADDAAVSIAIRLAARGDARSIETIVARFSPALHMQARHRLTAALRRHVDPTDIVNDVWLATLRRLPQFEPDKGRAVPTLLAYLGTAVLRRVYELHCKHFGGKPPILPAHADSGSGAPGPLADLSADTTGVVTKAVRAERFETLHRACDELDPVDRAVVVLRAIEQQPNEVVASVTGLTPNAISQRLRRGMAKLRERLPDSIFDDLDDE